MSTVMILANALAQTNNLIIDRLDIQYNNKTGKYSARLWLSNEGRRITIIYDIKEDGEVVKL